MDGNIKKEDIDKLCIKQLDSVIFDLTDSLGKKDISKALEVLNNLLYTKEPIQRILITLYNHFKKLYIVKLSERFHKDLATSMNLKPNQMFLTTKYKTQARYFETKELRRILDELINVSRINAICLFLFIVPCTISLFSNISQSKENNHASI